MKRLLLFALLCLSSPVWAHQVNTSYSTLTIDATGAGQFVLSVDEADLRLLAPELDTDGNGQLWPEEIIKGADVAQRLVLARVELTADGERVDLQSRHPKVQADDDGNLFLRVIADITIGAQVSGTTLDLSAFIAPPLLAEHRNLLQVGLAGQPEALIVLSADEPTHVIQLREPPQSMWTQIGRFIWLGVEHIWIGYDHILFLLALILVGSRLGQLVQVVSAFTVAHSITLVMAALEWVALPSRLVESGIALSIAYVAVENLWRRDPTAHRWILTFVFGFVHGFGFANVLRDLGLPTQGLVASLLAFNVGVEIGQVVIVAVLFPLLLWLARQSYHQQVVRVISVVILLFGMGWLVERVFDLSYMPL